MEQAKKKKQPLVRRARDEKGLTLLEYAAGAAFVGGILWVAMSTVDFAQLADALNGWIGGRSADLGN